MSKLNYVNIGCGSKFHRDWTNIDMASNSPHVKACNLLKGIPFPSNQFDVVYHSQVLEHFEKDKAPEFMQECFRVLKPGGIIRVVVPDLENIAKEYLKKLDENIKHPSDRSQADYDWIMLEMYDQTVRNISGGHMKKYLMQPELVNEDYVVDRIGYVAKHTRDNMLARETSKNRLSYILETVKRVGVARTAKFALAKAKGLLFSESKRIGTFRLGGEIHMWMYDQSSLSRILSEAGFEKITIKTAHESSIPEWQKYELDVKDGQAFDPTSLFMEAKKPE